MPPVFSAADRIAPPADAVSSLPETRIYESLQQQKDTALARAGTSRTGSANMDMITGNPAVRIEEISLSARMLVEMWREPTSYLRALIAQYLPGVNQDEMLDDFSLAADVMVRLFKENSIEALCEKTVNDEATTHLRIARAHLGPGTFVNPCIAKQFNADFDGDQLRVSFDPAAKAGAKNAIAYLLGTEGNLRIDPDFFAIHPMAGGVDGVKARLFKLFADFHPTDNQITGLVMAFEASWKKGESETGLKSMMRWARAIAANPGQTQPAPYIVGEILQRIYDLNSEILATNLIIRGVSDEFGVNIPKLETSSGTIEFPSSPIFFPRESAAELPANLRDANTAFNVVAGSVEGKNMPFRVHAGWLKMGRLSKLILGKSGGMARKLALDLLALQMNGLYDYGETSRAVSERARKAIVKVVGYPDYSSDKAFMRWLDKFVSVYNDVAFIINSASGLVRLDKTIAPSEKYYMDAIPDEWNTEKGRAALRKHFKSVFGNVRMGELFGSECPDGYKYVSLDDYIYNNRESTSFLGSAKDKITGVEMFIGRLADMRASFKRKIYDELHGTKDEPGALESLMMTDRQGQRVAKLAELIRIRQQNIDTRTGPTQLIAEMELLVEAFHFLGPEIFNYLGLDAATGYQTTELGRKFLSVRSADELLGVVYEAIASYRLAPVQKLRVKHDEAIANGDVDAVIKYSDRFEAELAELASSSDAWGALVRAYLSEWSRDGKDVFESILFSDNGAEWKDAEIAQLVLDDPLGRDTYHVWEVAADLYANPKGAHARNRFMSDFGHKDLLDDLKSVSSKMDAYAEVNWTHCVESVDTAQSQHEGSLKTFLEAVRSGFPLVDFQPWMMTDAILTIMEKTGASGEKASQEAAGNYIYSAVSFLMNGGVWSDMAFGGDFSVGKISLDRFWKTPMFLVRLLSDPKFTITVYDETGAEVTLSMKAVLGTTTPSESQLWKWLKENPRAAMSLRMMGQNNLTGSSGSTATKATKSLAATMTHVLSQKTESVSYADDRATLALADNAGFYALASLTIGMTGVRRFQVRDQLTDNITELIHFLRGLYKDGLPTKASVDSVVDQLFIDTYGAEHAAAIDSIYARGMAQDEDVDDADDVRYEDDFHLGQIKASMKIGILKYATMLAQPESGVPPMNRFSPKKVAELFKVGDVGTVGGYFDVEQTILNVKTELNTSVNGAESRRLAPAMFLSYITPEPCTVGDPMSDDATRIKIPAMKFSSRWGEYIGLQAFVAENKWIPVNETTWQDIAEMAFQGDGVVRIEDPATCSSPTCPCKRHATADQSTNYGRPSTPSFVRLLTIVRTLSAEQLNLKTKTMGNDLSDSVVKNRLFDIMSPDNLRISARVNTTYRRVLKKEGDPVKAMAEARKTLAAQLDRVFRSMRYSDEIRMNDYINIAQIMIREVPGADGIPELRVLSMGQINSLIGKAIEQARNANPKLTTDEYADFAKLALTDLDRIGGVLDIEKVMAGFKVHRESFLSPQLLSPYESSMPRNIEEVRKIIRETGVKPVGDAALDNFETQLMEEFPMAFGHWQKYAGSRPPRWYPGSEERYTYRVIGVFDTTPDGTDIDESRMLSVGPRNAYIISAKHSKAVAAVIEAYRHGINVLLEGELTRDQWAVIYKKTGLDPYQGKALRSSKGRVLGTLIPMFDLRLNGRNTTLREGGFNAGAVWAIPDGNLRFHFESKINEHRAGDADFVRTRMTDEIEHNRPGEYRVNANRAFGNLLSWVDPEEQDPTARVPQGKGDVRLVIFGSRDFDDYAALKRVIEQTSMYKHGLIAEVVSGDAEGADKLGARWARENGVPVKEMPAPWDDIYDENGKLKKNVRKNEYGKLYWKDAGKHRNEQMYEYATAGLGFWDGRSPGTKHMKYRFSEKGFAKNLMLVNTSDGKVYLNGEEYGGLSYVRERQHIVKERGVPEAEVALQFDVIMDILDPFSEGRFSDIPIDLGIAYVEEGGVEDTRLKEGIRTYAARLARGEVGDDGLVRTARPGEIIGFMRAEIGDEVRYHPIRLFERGNDSGAPTDMEITGARFDKATGDLVVQWVHAGTMANRFFKYFEDGNASVKLMARPEAIDDIALEDGTLTTGYFAAASVSTRRLLMRRQQKILTLIYKARTAPWGYNLAEVDGVLAGEKNKPLKDAILTGRTSIGIWKTRLKAGPIDFIADEDLNNLLNYLATRCVRYGIDPTIMFASHHDGVPNNMWFNYQLIIQGNRTYLNSIMRLMHLMNEALCPDGLEDTSGERTFFDRNLQVLRPVRDADGNTIGHERVDLFGGWHFNDDHYYGHNASGSKVSTYAIPSFPAMMAGGKKLSGYLLKLYLDWANIGHDDAMPARVRSADVPDED